MNVEREVRQEYEQGRATRCCIPPCPCDKKLVEKTPRNPGVALPYKWKCLVSNLARERKKRGEEKILLQDKWRKGAAMDSAGPVSVMMKKNLKALVIGAGLYLLGIGTAFGFQSTEQEVSAIAVEEVADLETEDVSDEIADEAVEETTEEVAEQVATDSVDKTANDQAVEPANYTAGPTWTNTAVTPSREGVEPVAGEALDEELIQEEEDDPFELNGGEVPNPDNMPAPPAIGGDVGVIIPGQDDETAGDAGENDTVVEEPSEDDSDDVVVDEPSEDQDADDDVVIDEPENPADNEGEEGEDNGDVSEPEAPEKGEDDVVVEEPETPAEEVEIPAEPTIVREWDETVVYESNGFLVTNVFHYVEYSDGEVILLYRTSSSEPIAEEVPATVDEPAQETAEEPVEVAPVEEAVEETVEAAETTEVAPEATEVPAA